MQNATRLWLTAEFAIFRARPSRLRHSDLLVPLLAHFGQKVMLVPMIEGSLYFTFTLGIVLPPLLARGAIVLCSPLILATSLRRKCGRI